MKPTLLTAIASGLALALGMASSASAQPSVDAVNGHSGPAGEATPASAEATALPANRALTPIMRGYWVSRADYPAEALQKKMQGLVAVELTVESDGSVSDCNVTRSSGHALLDRQTCVSMQQRARFYPATDAQGNPVGGTFKTSARWYIPQS